MAKYEVKDGVGIIPAGVKEIECTRKYCLARGAKEDW